MSRTILRLALLSAGLGFGQTAAPTFEVADIKPISTKDQIPGKGAFLPSGRIEMPGTLQMFVMFAYGVQPNMIVGAPGWFESDKFLIVAKAPPNTSMDTMRVMLRSLLAERFKLGVHNEDRPMPIYELVVAKGGPKMKESTEPGRQNCNWVPGENRLVRRECHNMTMAEMARQLPGWSGLGIDRPVIDSTGLIGTYDFQFDVAPVRREAGGISRDAPRIEERRGDATANDDSGPSVFEAMLQLGLKLESRKKPAPVIVIDHVERVPVEN